MISDPLNSHSNDKNVHKTRKKTPFFHGREGRRYKETAERVYQKKRQGQDTDTNLSTNF